MDVQSIAVGIEWTGRKGPIELYGAVAFTFPIYEHPI